MTEPFGPRLRKLIDSYDAKMLKLNGERDKAEQRYHDGLKEAEQIYRAAGIVMVEWMKAADKAKRKLTVREVAEQSGLGKSRVSELMRLGSGQTTIEKLRQRSRKSARAAMRKKRSLSANNHAVSGQEIETSSMSSAPDDETRGLSRHVRERAIHNAQSSIDTALIKWIEPVLADDINDELINVHQKAADTYQAAVDYLKAKRRARLRVVS